LRISFSELSFLAGIPAKKRRKIGTHLYYTRPCCCNVFYIICTLVLVPGVLKKPGPGFGIDPLAGIGITGFFSGIIPASGLSRDFEVGIPAGFGIRDFFNFLKFLN
jgi:hypothetical protein